jgi:putative aldouronate transport system substrate-binding protein
MKARLVFVIACLMCLLLPACRKGRASGSSQMNSPKALEEIGFIAEGDLIVSKPFTMTILMSKSPMNSSFESMELLKELQRVTGVTLKIIEIPESSFAEQKNLMLASGDVPDVFMSGIGDAEQVRYGPAGLLVPLEGLIKQYAPRVQALLDKRDDIRKYLITPDGHQYVFPGLDELISRTNQDNTFINKTWLDKLGLQIPTTPEEFYTILKAFKEQDPNGNGKRDEIPFSFAVFGTQFNIFSHYAAFGGYDYPNHLIVKNGKVFFTANTREWRNATTYFRRLYAEGLIDAEAFTQNRGTYFGKGQEPDVLYGVFTGWFDENEVGTERAKQHYVVLPPLIAVDGKQRWNKWPEMVLERFTFAITTKMKYPEVAVRFADLLYDTDWSFQMKYGPFGVCLEKQGERVVQLPPPEGMTMDEYRYANCPAINVPFALAEEEYARLSLAENAVRKHERYLMYRNYFIPDEMIYPSVFFLPVEQEELALLNIDIRDYVNEMRSKFIMGAEDINTAWDVYMQRLERSGLARYLAIHQAALDRYNRE